MSTSYHQARLLRTCPGVLYLHNRHTPLHCTITFSSCVAPLIRGTLAPCLHAVPRDTTVACRAGPSPSLRATSTQPCRCSSDVCTPQKTFAACPVNRLLAIACLLLPPAVQGQTFDQLTRPVATLARPAQIDTFLSELLIPPPDTISHLEVVDLTGNGYGPDDMVILYPSQTTYAISDAVPRILQDIMKTWELGADYRLDATLEESHSVEAEAHRRQDPRGAISGAVVSAIAEYYDGDGIDMRLSQGQDGLRLEMWNYDPDAMRYRPKPAAAACLSEAAQQFRFARPRFVMAFREPGTCIEAHQEDSRVITRACPDN